MIRVINPPPPGGSWRVRRLDDSEAARGAVLRHLQALDADDRYLRFGYAASDAVLADYVAGLDFARDGVLAVRAGSVSRSVLIGLAHVGRHPPQAEFGLSVLPGWRCRGLGRSLFAAAMIYAAEGACATLLCISGNASVLRMARELAFRIGPGSAEACASMRPRAPAVLTPGQLHPCSFRQAFDIPVAPQEHHPGVQVVVGGLADFFPEVTQTFVAHVDVAKLVAPGQRMP